LVERLSPKDSIKNESTSKGPGGDGGGGHGGGSPTTHGGDIVGHPARKSMGWGSRWKSMGWALDQVFCALPSIEALACEEMSLPGSADVFGYLQKR
jgi:hypothetical protein